MLTLLSALYRKQFRVQPIIRSPWYLYGATCREIIKEKLKTTISNYFTSSLYTWMFVTKTQQIVLDISTRIFFNFRKKNECSL